MTIAPSGTIRGRAVHSGEGAPGAARVVLPLRVADPATFAREKRRAEQRVDPRSPLSAALGPAATAAPLAAVSGSLNAAGLSASQEIAAYGHDGTPPDTTGAIGPEDYAEFVNSEVAAYKRSNLALVGSPVELSTFIGAVAPCDPQIKYDPKSSRWFYSAIRCDATKTSNVLYLGFSKTSDPTDFSTATGHGWCGYAYSTGSTIEDYDKLGLDSAHIMISSNSFNAQTGAFITAHILSLPKPASGKIETCPAAPKLTTFGSKTAPLRTSVESHLAFTPQPATVADESSSGFIVSADESTAGSGNGSHVMIWQLAGTGEKPELKALGAPKVAEFSLPPNVPQPGSSDGIDPLDGRLTQAVAAADPAAAGAEAVWTQHTVAGGAGSVVRWYELLPEKVEVRQAGTISDPSLFAFNGAIAPTRAGGAVIDYNTASSSALVKIMAQSRTSSDVAGTMNGPITLATSTVIDSDFSCPSVEPKATACRWGDYAGASVDPSNANVVWGSNQINGSARSEHQAQWATQNFALTPSVAPTVETDAASGVEQTSATLHGTVNPNGSEVTDCHFEYGTTQAYGASAPCTPAPGSGSSPVAVSASLTGLTGNVTYHFRISATNAGGSSSGSDRTFTTPSPPTVETGEASAVTQTSATLNASVNPNGVEVTECVFEYGPSTSYGESAPCTPSPGSGTSPVAVSAALESLAENSTYHYRISADGNSFGEDKTFTTTLVLGPHWYKNGVKLVADKGLPVLNWGTLTLTNSSVGTLNCQTAGGGQLENPSGGGAGKGTMQGFIAYACVAPACEALGGKAELVPEKLPWSAVAIEEAPLFRHKLEGIGLRAICLAGQQNVLFHGSLRPEFTAGTTQGAAPAQLELGAGSGSLESSAGAGEVSGTLKLFGFSEGQIIALRNP